MPEPVKRLLFLPVNMWGHVRPLCPLAERIVRLRLVTIDFFIAEKFLERARVELARYLLPEESHLLSRINFIPVEQGDLPLDKTIYEPAFLAAWDTLRAGRSFDTVAADSTPWSVSLKDGPRLSSAIVDMFMIGAFRRIQKDRDSLGGGAGLQLYTWYTSASSMYWHWFAEDRVPLAEAIAARKGISFDNAANKSWGEVLRSPCLPPVHDSEWHPQQVPPLPSRRSPFVLTQIVFPPRLSGSVLIQTAGRPPPPLLLIAIPAVYWRGRQGPARG
ncbi:hypothetical protein BD413DRAFT_617451 [Trametes elegans]|nr:hypothetical protein BD413DRAFT_617451 [Trametes elegans]